MDIFQNLLDLFYPNLCIGCDEVLLPTENLICSNCRHLLPETHFCTMPENSMKELFIGRIPIKDAATLLYFRKDGISQKLIHHLKYKGRQEVGGFFADWILKNIENSTKFRNIEAIVKVPLHPKKQKIRGYNQLTVFADVLSKGLSIPVVENVLVKIGSTSSQTKKTRFARFDHIDEKFHLINFDLLKNKHVLLVDDVLTTGATLEACANELLKIPGISISILTMVIAEHV